MACIGVSRRTRGRKPNANARREIITMNWGRVFKIQNWPSEVFRFVEAACRPILIFERPTPSSLRPRACPAGLTALRMPLPLIVCLGCSRSPIPVTTTTTLRYVPLAPIPAGTKSRISEDIQSIKNEPPKVVNRTRFTEVVDSGIDFVYENGAHGKLLMVEATGGGAGWLDYDCDGLQDLYLCQGGNPALPATPEQPIDRLFRNLGDGHFADVTAATSIEEHAYGQGVAAGDYDNDGFDDVFVTNVGLNVLYRNQGDGTFHPVEVEPPSTAPAWSTSAAWGDIDRDGDLDLYLPHYCYYDPLNPRPCSKQNGEPGTCHPKEVDPLPDECYLNEGDGTFRAIARERGLFGPGNRALGVAIADFDNDDWPDIFVANDTTENFLVHQPPKWFV